jgi:hypothetical protein
MMMTIQEMTKHFRGRVSASDIKARVRVAPGGGQIQVFVPAHGMEFSAKEQKQIRLIAKCNLLTLVKGLEIDVDQMTNPHSFNFYMPEAL